MGPLEFPRCASRDSVRGRLHGRVRRQHGAVSCRSAITDHSVGASVPPRRSTDHRGVSARRNTRPWCSVSARGCSLGWERPPCLPRSQLGTNGVRVARTTLVSLSLAASPDHPCHGTPLLSEFATSVNSLHLGAGNLRSRRQVRNSRKAVPGNAQRS
jgi:hypothetical protein